MINYLKLYTVQPECLPRIKSNVGLMDPDWLQSQNPAVTIVGKRRLLDEDRMVCVLTIQSSTYGRDDYCKKC